MSDQRPPSGRPEYESDSRYAGGHDGDYGYEYSRPYEPAHDRARASDVDQGYTSDYTSDYGSDYGYEPEYDRYEYDDGRRALPTAVGTHPISRGEARRLQAAARRKRRGRIIGVLAGAVLLGGMGAAAVAVYDKVSGRDVADYAGPGGPEVVVQVHPGDTANQIADEMAAKDVVKSEAAFYRAALRNDAMSAVQPGYYSISTRISGSDAVSALVSPDARVGALVISEGRQLHDTRDVQTGAVKKGIYTLIAEASCVGPADAQKCLTYDQLNEAGAGPDLAALGVPDWAQAAVANVPDRDRQLEGLIAAGSWDFDPTQTPAEILRQLVSSSAESYEATGLERGWQRRARAVPDAHRRVARRTRGVALGLRQGRAGGGEPACGRPTVAVRLDGQLRTRHDGGRDHRRRSCPGHAVEHVRHAGPARDADCVPEHQCASRGGESGAR